MSSRETPVEKYLRRSLDHMREKDEAKYDLIGDELDMLWWSMTDAEQAACNKACLEDTKKA